MEVAKASKDNWLKNLLSNAGIEVRTKPKKKKKKVVWFDDQYANSMTGPISSVHSFDKDMSIF